MVSWELRTWLTHLLRLVVILGWTALSVGVASMVSPGINKWADAATRLVLLLILTLPALWVWGRKHGWAGLLPWGTGAKFAHDGVRRP